MSCRDFTVAEKDTICRVGVQRLNDMGKSPDVTESSRKSMFIILLVQVLSTRDAGIQAGDDGAVFVKSSNKLNWYFEDSKITEFVKDLVELRNDITVAYGLDSTLSKLDELWGKPELYEVCRKLGVRLKW